MSVNPDKRAPEDEPTPADAAPEAEAAPQVELAPEPTPALAVEPPGADIPAELFAEPAAPTATPEPAPLAAAPEPGSLPEPEPEAPLAIEPARRVRATPASKPAPAPRPAPPLAAAPAPVPDYGAPIAPDRGDFDAVFEARADASLGDRLLPTACYLMMVIGPLFLGLSAIPAAVLAYMNRETAPAWIQSHYIFQIRTFWAGLVMALIAGGTFFFIDRGVFAVIFGAVWAVIMLLGVVWFVLRSAVGLLRLRRGEAIRNPRAWSI